MISTKKQQWDGSSLVVVICAQTKGCKKTSRSSLHTLLAVQRSPLFSKPHRPIHSLPSSCPPYHHALLLFTTRTGMSALISATTWVQHSPSSPSRTVRSTLSLHHALLLFTNKNRDVCSHCARSKIEKCKENETSNTFGRRGIMESWHRMRP